MLTANSDRIEIVVATMNEKCLMEDDECCDYEAGAIKTNGGLGCGMWGGSKIQSLLAIFQL